MRPCELGPSCGFGATVDPEWSLELHVTPFRRRPETRSGRVAEAFWKVGRIGIEGNERKISSVVSRTFGPSGEGEVVEARGVDDEGADPCGGNPSRCGFGDSLEDRSAFNSAGLYRMGKVGREIHERRSRSPDRDLP